MAMIRVLGPGLVGMIALAIWVFCVFDVIAAEPILIRNLPKPLWLMIVIFVPTVGAIAWLALGRPLFAGWRPGETSARPPPRQILGPEDDPAFGSRTAPSRADEDHLRRWEDDLKRREDELRSREDEADEDEAGDLS